MLPCLVVSAVSLLQSERFMLRDRRSEQRNVGDTIHVFRQGEFLEGESHFCGFTSSGGLLNVGLESAPIWSKYLEVHRLQRSRGCDGRYLIWKCTEEDTCGGLGDEIRGIAAMLYLSIATDRALVLDWRKDGVSYAGNIFGVKTVNWTMPENCMWKSTHFHVIDPPFEGVNNLVKSSEEIAIQQDHVAATESTSNHANASFLAVKTKIADLVNGVQSMMQVVQVITNLPTPQQSPDTWKAALELLPALKELSGLATLSVGCAYRFLFEPSSTLREAYERMRIPSTSFIGIHLRVGDQEMQRSPADMSRWELGISLLAECVETGFALLRSNDFAATACQKPASALAFFSDSHAVKEFSKAAGMLVTEVVPLHSEKNRMSAEQRVKTVAELHALADSAIFLTDTRRSGFANLALELGTIHQGKRLESFGMRIRPAVVELCKDRARGQQFQTFGDSSPAALAWDKRQEDDVCVALRRTSGAESMQAQREENTGRPY